MKPKWHRHTEDNDFAPLGAILCGKCTTQATKCRDKLAVDTDWGYDAFDQISKAFENLEDLKILQIRQIATQNQIVPRGQKRRTKADWTKAISEHQDKGIITRGARVIIEGLIKRKDLNGQISQVIEWNHEKARWRIRTQEGEEVNIKPKISR